MGRKLTKMKYDGAFRSDGNILYTDYSGDYTIIYLSKLINCSPKKGDFHCHQIISQ